jgi:serine/threonine protein phosphatase PrpC
MSQASPTTPDAGAVVTCPNCGASNRPEARFCYRCRTPLITSPEAAMPPAETLADVRMADTAPEAAPLRAVADTTVPLARVTGLAGATRPLGARPDFPPRPEGSFFSRRYEYEVLVAADGALNVYRVWDTRPLQVCSNGACDLRGVLQSPTEAGGCMRCGSPLSDGRNLRKRIKESLAPDVLGREPEIAQRGLAHAGLLAPTHYFTERLGPDVRHCVVSPEPPQDRASSLQPPQPVNAVIQWGLELAEGLGHLHSHRITFAPGGRTPEAVADHIAFTPYGAAWVDFAACHAWPLEVAPDTMRDEVRQDLRALAGEMLAMLTGARDLAGARSGSLHPKVREFFAQALPPGPGFDSSAELMLALGTLKTALAEIADAGNLRVDLIVARATHVGQVRQLNEDSLMVMEMVRIHESRARPMGLFVVADGMGGQQNGEVASRLAVEAIATRAYQDLFSASGPANHQDPAAWIAAATEAAHELVSERRAAAQSDMGSTLVIGVVDGVNASVASIGDSRAYLIDASGQLSQLTKDDSLVQRLLDANQITAEEARQHPKRSVILRALGSGAFKPPDVVTRELYLGDRLLLCSDGLSSMLDDTVIARLAASAESRTPQEACARLIEAANASGGEDNISVIVVELAAIA